MAPPERVAPVSPSAMVRAVVVNALEAGRTDLKMVWRSMMIEIEELGYEVMARFWMMVVVVVLRW